MKQLEQFINVPFLPVEEAEKQGIPRHALAYLEKRGDLERIYPGHIASLNMNQKSNFSGRT